VLRYREESADLAAAIGIVLLLTAAYFRHFVVERVRAFFTEPGPAINLAIFRVIFYATALFLVGVPPGQVKAFAGLPRILRVPPRGFVRGSELMPISQTWVEVAFLLLIITSVTAAIGLFTRLSSIVWFIAAFYYLTIPQLFGKVNHYHIILWVAALLSVSRTADEWSVYSLRRADRDARSGQRAIPAPSLSYSLPLRLTWLFLGITYLLPGYFKFHDIGLDQVIPKNIRHIFYQKWYELGGIDPRSPSTSWIR